MFEADTGETRHTTPRTIDGFTYQTWYSAPLHGTQVIIGGNGLLFDDRDGRFVVQGSVTGLIGPFTADGSNREVGIHGISVSLMDLLEAVTDFDRGSDFALLRGELQGNDTFALSNFADLARGFAGSDRMDGNGGADRLYGGTGADRLIGDGGNDRLWGEAGNDLIQGGYGNDILTAGAGRDTLDGGQGADQLNGGGDAGSDVFDFNSRYDSGNTSASRDTIHSFTSGADDIDLRGIDARAGSASTNEAFRWGNQTAGAHSVWWTRGPDGVILRADVTGDARADFEILLNDVSRIVASDVLL